MDTPGKISTSQFLRQVEIFYFPTKKDLTLMFYLIILYQLKKQEENMRDVSSELFNNDIRDLFSMNDDDKEVDLRKLHSSFWMRQLPEKNVDLITLASYRRAVARFVRIATGKDIPVHFSSGNDSYTDIKNKVVLSAQIKNSEFDAVVGTALHESYHILKTDPDILNKNFSYDKNTKTFTKPLPKRLADEANRLGMSKKSVMSLLKDIFNVVEDRRIDGLAYNEIPGYRMYYQKAYKKYWCSDLVDKVMTSELFRAPFYINLKGQPDPLGSYEYRVINIVNKNTDLDALPGLRDIWKVLDLDTITQMKGSEEAYKVAVEITHIILSNIIELPKGKDGDESNESNENKDGEGGSGESGESGEMSDLPNLDGNPQESDDMSDEPDEESLKKAMEDYNKLSDENKKKLQEQMKRLKDFLNGEEEKESLTNEQENQLDTIEKSGMTLESVDGKNKQDSSGNEPSPTNVLVVRKLTKDILSNLTGLQSFMSDYSSEAVTEGFRLGRLLAKRLQIRNDTKFYSSKRKTSGKLDKRMLYNVGMGNTSVFEKIRKDEYGDAIVHISIDASGSMSGNEWHNSLTSAIAIAYAADKTKNLDVIISFRSVESYASMVIGYDSRIDDMSKIKTLFPYLAPKGSATPEGLCYEAIMKDILSSVAGKTGYFINFSDGMPNMGTRQRSASQITKEAVAKMRAANIRVLSFFISDYAFGNDAFREMYGKDAKTIDVTSIVPLAKELNKMFATEK